MADPSIRIQMVVIRVLPYFAAFVRKQACTASACHSSNCIAPSFLVPTVACH
jgi:hypothetical protein